MHAIHITILPTSTSDIDPLCITVPRPTTQVVSYDVCKEIRQLLDGYISALKTTYTNNKQYWTMRVNQNNKMKVDFLNLSNIQVRNLTIKEILS